MQRILVVEDDVIICGGLKVFLEGKGFEVLAANTMAEAREALAHGCGLVLLDIRLPDGSGLELCQEIRSAADIPVIFLTANDTEQDMIEGFRKGCDDYIAKPFSVELLYQRVAAVLRRTEKALGNECFEYQGLTVDFHRKSVSVEGSPVKLSVTEYRLLELLVRNRGQVLTRQSILERVWDCDGNFVDENTLNVHITRLRQKIEKDSKNPVYILTVFGIGYTFGE